MPIFPLLNTILKGLKTGSVIEYIKFTIGFERGAETQERITLKSII